MSPSNTFLPGNAWWFKKQKRLLPSAGKPESITLDFYMKSGNIIRMSGIDKYHISHNTMSGGVGSVTLTYKDNVFPQILVPTIVLSQIECVVRVS